MFKTILQEKFPEVKENLHLYIEKYTIAMET